MHEGKPDTRESTLRTVRSMDVRAQDVGTVANGIEDLYNDTVDVILIRGALDPAPLEAAAARLDGEGAAVDWARPNQAMPVEDIQLLGTAAPATPTFSNPRGASLESYLDHASQHGSATDGVFESSFNPRQEIERTLARFANGRPVELPASADGRAYVPFTIRRLVDGKQIGLHHDYHYPLPLYSDLAPRLDTATLVSFVVTLRKPDAGGELFVYGVTPTTPDAPKLANGYAWDQQALEQRFEFSRFVPEVGDLFLLASGRCLHRVGRIAGPRARVTMGGFLALDKERRRVYYWS